MAHVSHDRGDIIDILEESVTTGGWVEVELRGGKRFVDHARDVVTKNGEDFVEFTAEGRYGVSDIEDCSRAPGPQLNSTEHH
jgi:hypothetical protein